MAGDEGEALKEAPGTRAIVEASKVVDAVMRLPAPPLLFHYTNVDGLLGILKTGRIWATDVRSLKDRSELTRALELIGDVLDERSPEGTIEAAALGSVADGLSGLLGSSLDLLVTCFCSEGDLLSRWRGASNGSEYSLGLRSASFIGSMVGGVLLPVVYDEERQRRHVDDVLDRGLQIAADLTSAEDLQAAVAEMHAALTFLALAFKDPAFREEREWRFVILRNAGEQKIEFRGGDEFPIPYMQIPLNAGLALRSVTCGPAPEPETSARSTEMLLRSLGLDAQVEVSKVPLR